MTAELIWRLLLGLQFLFFGLNAFLNWFPLPKPNVLMLSAIESLEKLRFILPSVKALQILTGLCLVLNFKVFLSWLALGPIVFGIIALHLLFNFQKSWIILIQVLLPYLAFGFCHQHELLLLLSL